MVDALEVINQNICLPPFSPLNLTSNSNTRIQQRVKVQIESKRHKSR